MDGAGRRQTVKRQKGRQRKRVARDEGDLGTSPSPSSSRRRCCLLPAQTARATTSCRLPCIIRCCSVVWACGPCKSVSRSVTSVSRSPSIIGPPRRDGEGPAQMPACLPASTAQTSPRDATTSPLLLCVRAHTNQSINLPKKEARYAPSGEGPTPRLNRIHPVHGQHCQVGLPVAAQPFLSSSSSSSSSPPASASQPSPFTLHRPPCARGRAGGRGAARLRSTPLAPACLPACGRGRLPSPPGHRP